MLTTLKKISARRVWGAALLTFICGVAAASAFRPAATGRAPNQPDPIPAMSIAMPYPPPAETTYEPDWGDSPEGEEWKHRNNGAALGLDYGRLGAGELAGAKVETLASGRVLVAAGHTLSMFDGGGRAVWAHAEQQPVFDFAYVGARELVYVTAGDNNMFILDARTGRELRRASRSGRAGFGQAVAFGRDLCLVTDDNSGYRSRGDLIPPTSDGVTAWRGTTMLWHRKLPPGAELRVSGDSIFAVTRTSTRILVREIPVPAAGR